MLEIKKIAIIDEVIIQYLHIDRSFGCSYLSIKKPPYGAAKQLTQ